MHFLYLFVIIAISAADESEIVTTVNCTIGGPRSETIEGVYDKKWEFMRNSCPRNVSLHIRITKVELCNNPEPVEEHAILVIEKKQTPSRSGQIVRISSALAKVIGLWTFQQVDLYSTIHSHLKKNDCSFIVGFTYFFASSAETTTPLTQLPTKSTSVSTAATTAKFTTTQPAVSVSSAQAPLQPTQDFVTHDTPVHFGLTNADVERKDRGHITQSSNDETQSPCSTDNTASILLGILFGGTFLGLIYFVIKYRQQNALQQGELTSKDPPIAKEDGNDVAETRVNEIYSMG